jgi:hypothetical protein
VLVKSEIDETLAVGVDGADGRFMATSLVMAATTQKICGLDRLERQTDPTWAKTGLKTARRRHEAVKGSAPEA